MVDLAHETLQTYIQRRFGVSVYPQVSAPTFSMGIVAAPILKQNANRLLAMFVNLSLNALYVAPDNLVGANHGISISPSGGSLTLLAEEDFDLVGLEWFGIAGAAASSVFVLELLTSPYEKG